MAFFGVIPFGPEQLERMTGVQDRKGFYLQDDVEQGEDFIFEDFNPSAERTEKTKRKDVLGKSVLHAIPTIAEFGLFDVFQTVFRELLLYKSQFIKF